MIDDLPPLTPDVTRSVRTIARCHNRLAARRRQIQVRHATTRAYAAERWLAAGISVVYLLAMAGHLLAVAAMR